MARKLVDGKAKTQFTSFVFLYHTLLYSFNNPDKCKVKIFYYNLEESAEDIMLRFMGYLLYVLSNKQVRISGTNLKSTKANHPVSQDVLNLLRTPQYQALLKHFEDNVIFSDSCNPSGVYKECKKYAEDNGTVHSRQIHKKDELGNPVTIDVFDYYTPNDPDEYKIIFVDHISLLHQERGMSLKQTIDKLSEYCVILRNRYNFTPVVIQQQAFQGESLDAIKENKLTPTIANMSDSKYVSRDANMVIGLFSPFKHALETYFGYDIRQFRDNCRFAEILVNRNGSPGTVMPLYFDGCVNYFAELPKPYDIAKLNKYYTYLNNIRNPETRINVSYFAYKPKRKKK
jgi:hypothetical protein